MKSRGKENKRSPRVQTSHHKLLTPRFFPAKSSPFKISRSPEDWTARGSPTKSRALKLRNSPAHLVSPHRRNPLVPMGGDGLEDVPYAQAILREVKEGKKKMNIKVNWEVTVNSSSDDSEE